MTDPFSVRQVEPSTPQVRAAAVTSMARAVAPAWRIGSYLVRTLELPPVSWSPNFGSAQACSTRTRDQSASSSSATIIASDVRTPWPISDLLAQMVTSPWGSICRKALGESLDPRIFCGPEA